MSGNFVNIYNYLKGQNMVPKRLKV
jgi:hypothetical protein